MAKNVFQLIHISLTPFIFLGVFYAINYPRATFFEYYYIIWLLSYCGYGFGYLISVSVPNNLAQVTSAVISTIGFLFNGKFL
jgi:hypothetical protein